MGMGPRRHGSDDRTFHHHPSPLPHQPQSNRRPREVGDPSPTPSRQTTRARQTQLDRRPREVEDPSPTPSRQTTRARQTQPDRRSRPANPSSPRSRGPIPGPSPAEADDTNDQRGLYDIDRKIAEAQQDPAHPVHKFVQAYDEVAAAFHGKDKENDEDEEVRYWISGEVPDAYGKYIWEYAPAYPRSIRRRLRPRRRRRSTPKAESVWMPRPSDKMREAGIPKPRRTLMWI